ncbi:MAG: sel1 repeat family protein [Nitrospira sp.]|nr:sel1 repeat family protein [Nitrospira sp.]
MQTVPPPAPPQEYASVAKPVIESPSFSSNPDIRLAEQGDAFAQYRLGRFYARLAGLEAPEAVHWYRKAFDGLRRLAEDGNGEAMHVLGVMYAFGRGVPKDKDRARRWLTQATEHEVPAARHVLVSLETRPTAARNPQAFVSH